MKLYTKIVSSCFECPKCNDFGRKTKCQLLNRKFTSEEEKGFQILKDCPLDDY